MHYPGSIEQKVESAQQLLGYHGHALNVQQQLWLLLARELAQQGLVDLERLACAAEVEAQRFPNDPAWFYGLLESAHLLRGQQADPHSYVR